MDRFAAIADIHGNRWALEAVLADIDRRGISRIVNLGDHLFGPLDPAGTADLLIGLRPPWVVKNIAGNQDRDPMDLSPSHQEWLDALPFSLQLPGMTLFHGTPLADNLYLLETVHRDGVSLAKPEQIAERLGSGEHSPLLLCGHTHIPRVVAFGETLIVNPGSVGLQAYTDDAPLPHRMETGSPHARYAILEQDTAGWRVDLLQVPYDYEAAAACALRNGREDWAFRLRTGRAAN